MTASIAALCPKCGHLFRPNVAPFTATDAWPVQDVGIVLAGAGDEHLGLLAWATVIVGTFRLDGMAVRRGLDGELVVIYPARKDARGGLHRSITPLEPELDSRIRAAVIAAYMEARRREVRL
jgi:hypothetical protein